MPNLHQVNKVADLMLDINKTINFCLDIVPLLSDQTNQTNSTASDSHSYNPKPVWYFYIIGSAALIIFVIFICITLILRRRFKRRENLRQLGDGVNNRMQVMTSNSSESNPQSAVADVWEVKLISLNIDFTTTIGKGAFSVVYSGEC
jgi:p-aminobenzoyl-glutamate transporter AbgT